MILVVIPARFASTRFPGKPLIDIRGMSMIHRVYTQVKKSGADRVVVATDDRRIFDHVIAFGGEAEMTSDAHPSGTDRCAEVARKFEQAEFVVNVQGDEPFIRPEQVDLLIGVLRERDFPIATLARAIDKEEELSSPHVVKVVFSEQHGALYFSRQPIPYLRDVAQADWASAGRHFKHLGIYGYRRDALLGIAGLSPSALEQAESLEQLRWLENGYRIGVAATPFDSLGIDTPADLDKIAGFTGAQEP